MPTVVLGGGLVPVFLESRWIIWREGGLSSGRELDPTGATS